MRSGKRRGLGIAGAACSGIAMAAAIAVAAEPRLPRGCRVTSGGPTGAPPAMGAIEYYRFECAGSVTGDLWRFGAVPLAQARFDEDRHDIRPTNRFGDSSFQRTERGKKRGAVKLHTVVRRGPLVFDLTGLEWQRDRLEKLVREIVTAN